MTDDDLLHSVRAAAADEFDVIGSLGSAGAGVTVFLARDLAKGELALLRLERDGTDPDGHPQYALDVRRELDPSIPEPESPCPRCRATLREWARFCTQCGADVSGLGPSTSQALSREDLLEAVRQAAEDQFVVLGDMPRKQGGGLVYFAQERGSERIVALKLSRDAQDQFELGVTRIVRPRGAPTPKPRPAPERVAPVTLISAKRPDPQVPAGPSRPVSEPVRTPIHSAPAAPPASSARVLAAAAALVGIVGLVGILWPEAPMLIRVVGLACIVGAGWLFMSRRGGAARDGAQTVRRGRL